MALAWGSMFSALEVVPLLLVGYSALARPAHVAGRAQWARKYQWPIYFFVAVAFWNMVGAGLFGFMINPPIALYYMQGLNTTPVHGHAALFGVYGMLGIGLMLVCLRALTADRTWREGLLAFAFWAHEHRPAGHVRAEPAAGRPAADLGLGATTATGTRAAPSSWRRRCMQTLRWMRVPGDTLFALGAIALVVFVFGLYFGWSLGAREARPHAGDTGGRRAA